MKLNKHLTVKGQIKDRGRIKWTAMMLPEHVEMLRDLQKENHSYKKPDLDEFDLAAIHEEIELAHMRHCGIELQVWRDEPLLFSGKVSRIDLPKKSLYLELDQETIKVPFDEIIGAHTLE